MKWGTSILFLFIIIICTGSITNYKVPTSIPLGQTLTIQGNLVPAVANIPCSFTIWNDQNNLVKRLTTEYTTASGYFASTYYIVDETSDRPLYRGLDYNASTDCDGNYSTAVFRVAQRQNIVHTFTQETNYVFDQKNLDLIFFLGILVLGIILISSIVYYVYKKGSNW